MGMLTQLPPKIKELLGGDSQCQVQRHVSYEFWRWRFSEWSLFLSPHPPPPDPGGLLVSLLCPPLKGELGEVRTFSRKWSFSLFVQIQGRNRESFKGKALRRRPEPQAGALYPSPRFPHSLSFKDPETNSHVEGRRHISSQTHGRCPHMRSLPPTGRERYCRRGCQRSPHPVPFVSMFVERLFRTRRRGPCPHGVYSLMRQIPATEVVIATSSAFWWKPLFL